jgi:hypothetical protein
VASALSRVLSMDFLDLGLSLVFDQAESHGACIVDFKRACSIKLDSAGNNLQGGDNSVDSVEFKLF